MARRYKSGQKVIGTAIWLAALTTFLLAGFQNCVRSGTSSTGTSDWKLNPPLRDVGGGNGDPYGGMQKGSFFFLSPGFTCPGPQGEMVASYREKIEISDAGASLTVNQCDSVIVSEVDLDSIRAREGLLQYGRNLYYELNVGENGSITEYANSDYRWAENSCFSKAESGEPAPTYHYRLSMMTNYSGVRTVIVNRTTIDGLGNETTTEHSVDFVLHSHKLWSNSEITVSVFDDLNRGEFSLIEDGVPRTVALECSLPSGNGRP